MILVPFIGGGLLWGIPFIFVFALLQSKSPVLQIVVSALVATAITGVIFALIGWGVDNMEMGLKVGLLVCPLVGGILCLIYLGTSCK